MLRPVLTLLLALVAHLSVDGSGCTPDPAWPENYCEGDEPHRPEGWPGNEPADADPATPTTAHPTYTG